MKLETHILTQNIVLFTPRLHIAIAFHQGQETQWQNSGA